MQTSQFGKNQKKTCIYAITQAGPLGLNAVLTPDVRRTVAKLGRDNRNAAAPQINQSRCFETHDYSCVLVGAFKTLDKDNSGSIELDIKEVKHYRYKFSMNEGFPKQLSISHKNLFISQ